jgi:hypothetical protein
MFTKLHNEANNYDKNSTLISRLKDIRECLIIGIHGSYTDGLVIKLYLYTTKNKGSVLQRNRCERALSSIKPYSVTYLRTPCSRVLLEQLVKKFPAFYGNRRFTAAFTSGRHLSLLSQINPVHAPTSQIPKIHLNITLLTTHGSFKWSLYLRFPHQNPVYISPLPHTCTQ